MKKSKICTKCGGTNISCEAMINPNNKKFINYTDESFLYGWFEDCKTGIIITDTAEIKAEIKCKFKEFVDYNRKEPQYAVCGITWKDTNKQEDVKIQLSCDSNPDKEDDIFFYCNSLTGFESLCEFGGEDFIVTEMYSFENYTY